MSHFGTVQFGEHLPRLHFVPQADAHTGDSARNQWTHARKLIAIMTYRTNHLDIAGQLGLSDGYKLDRIALLDTRGKLDAVS